MVSHAAILTRKFYTMEKLNQFSSFFFFFPTNLPAEGLLSILDRAQDTKATLEV